VVARERDGSMESESESELTPEDGHVILVGQELLQLLGIDLLDDGFRFNGRHWLRALLAVVVGSAVHISGKTQCQQSAHEQRKSLEASESHPSIRSLTHNRLRSIYLRFDGILSP